MTPSAIAPPNTTEFKPINRVIISYEGDQRGGDFGAAFAVGLRELGCEVNFLPRTGALESDADLVLAYGPFNLAHSMLYPGRQLVTMPPTTRPLFAWWLTEGIPDRRIPASFAPRLASLRLQADDLYRSVPRLRAGLNSVGVDRAWRAGHRLRVLGELLRLRANGVLDILAVTSASRADYLRALGFDPLVVPLGYQREYGTDLGLARDIPAAFLGNTAAPRRQRLLPPLQSALTARGISLVVQNDLYGAARTAFLNRTQILVNILRAPQDHVGQRLLLAAANKTLLISEPVPDVEPFVPGVHMVVTPLDRMAETVAYYLDHPAERVKIVEAAYELATVDLHTTKMVERILDRANEIAAGRRQLYA